MSGKRSYNKGVIGSQDEKNARQLILQKIEKDILELFQQHGASEFVNLPQVTPLQKDATIFVSKAMKPIDPTKKPLLEIDP